MLSYQLKHWDILVHQKGSDDSIFYQINFCSNMVANFLWSWLHVFSTWMFELSFKHSLDAKDVTTPINKIWKMHFECWLWWHQHFHRSNHSIHREYVFNDHPMCWWVWTMTSYSWLWSQYVSLCLIQVLLLHTVLLNLWQEFQLISRSLFDNAFYTVHSAFNTICHLWRVSSTFNSRFPDVDP